MKARPVVRNVVWLLAALVLAAATFMPAVSASAETAGSFDVRFTGVITTPGNPNTPWVIGGQTVATDASTRIVLTVRPVVPGRWADVTAVRLSNGSLLAKQITVRPEQVQLRGIVSTKPEAEAGVGDWIIAGVTVKVTSDTKFGTRGGPVDVNKWVEAVMQEDNGVLTALRIFGIEPQDDVEVTGAIQDFSAESWVLSSIRLNLDADTLIAGAPAVDLIAHASVRLQDNGPLLAKRLRVMWTERQQPAFVSFDGTIEKMPQVGLWGEWQVAGKKVVVPPSARINQERGLAVVGAQVNVAGMEMAGQVTAHQITVLQSGMEGGRFITFEGRIEALPEGTVLGTWTVGGRPVEVSARTLLEPRGVTPKTGARAYVEGVRRASDGVIVASLVRVRLNGGPGDVDPVPAAPDLAPATEAAEQ